MAKHYIEVETLKKMIPYQDSHNEIDKLWVKIINDLIDNAPEADLSKVDKDKAED